LGELKFLSGKKQKVQQVRVWFGPNWKVGKVKVGHFVEKKVLKVKVYEMKFKKSKVELKLAKSIQLCITLKVGLAFFCLWQDQLKLERYEDTGLLCHPTNIPTMMRDNKRCQPPRTNARPNNAITMETPRIGHKFDKQPRSN
jgi:hypothetical protein